MIAKANMLPRLLYIADVAVEASYYGSALVYRLLERYPVEQLRIVEAGLSVSSADRRLRAVRYQECLPRWPRLAHTRFSRLYWSFLLLSADARARRLMRLVREFQPEAILSVTHGHSFITAARLARRIHVPLHLICHDEWFVHPLFCDAACKDRIFGRSTAQPPRGYASRLSWPKYIKCATMRAVLFSIPRALMMRQSSMSPPAGSLPLVENSCVPTQGVLRPDMPLRWNCWPNISFLLADVF